MGDIKNRRAVSPVIATVILVAVAITIAVAVSYWMGGISSQYTRFEKIELTSAYCELTTGLDWDTESGAACWVITVDFRNTGTTEASVIGTFVNAKKIADYGYYTLGTGVEFSDDHMRAYDDSIVAANQLNFEEVSGHTNPTKVTVTPGSEGKIVLEIKEAPLGTAYDLSSGTTVEVSLVTGAGNTYMKMITLS